MHHTSFHPLNRAFANVYNPSMLSLGLVVPIESYPYSPVPEMKAHLARAQLAEKLGFAALWLRDVPLNVPSFGDAGQPFDPFVYLGFLAASTQSIALGVASIVLPLRHPLHTAKAAASVDQLSNGRLLLGVASGDRPEEYPAMGADFGFRGERFRESFAYIRALAETNPEFQNAIGRLSHVDMLPKPTADRLPLLITGSSRQDPDWIAEHSDGWITYPRSAPAQAQIIGEYRARVADKGLGNKPVTQSLYIDVTDDPNTPPSPIHLGFRCGTNALIDYLASIREIGVNHVALNLRFNQLNIEETLERLAQDVLPHFQTKDTQP